MVHNRRTTRNVIVLSIATVTLVNILICVSRVYEGESPMLNIVTKVLYVGFSFTILTICAGIFSQSEQEEQIGILHRHGARFHRRQRRRAREGVGIALDGGRRERSHLHGIGYEQKHAAHQRGVKGLRPNPPKVILATPIATAEPMTTIHHGIEAGRLNASSKPVTAAERFDTVGSPPSRNFCMRNSITTQLTTAMADTVSTSVPYTQVDTANAGSSAEKANSASKRARRHSF